MPRAVLDSDEIIEAADFDEARTGGAGYAANGASVSANWCGAVHLGALGNQLSCTSRQVSRRYGSTGRSGDHKYIAEEQPTW